MNKKIILLSSAFLVVSFVGFYSIFFFNSSINILSEKDAFTIVYGNYNVAHKGALWVNMNLPNSKEFDKQLWKNRTGAVSEVFFKPFKEAGKNKIFFVTKTIPTSEPYECHACLPLLSATIFVNDKKKWRVESQNLFLMQEGEYAASPVTKLIQIGPDKHGITFECEHRYGEFLAKSLYLIVPYKKFITNALEETVYYDNFNHCGRGVQCTTFSASLHFSNPPKDEFYPLKIKRFGTRNDEKQDYRAVPVDEESTYLYRNGKYVQIDWHGYPKFDYTKLLDEEGI